MYLIVHGSAGGAGMADIFISYSKKHAALTEALARDLEAEGYTTWWDTNLLPDDGFFPETIRAQIAAAKAVIVIWAEHSVASRWVYAEASEGDAHGKLLQVRDEVLDPRRVPMPFTSGNITLVRDRAKICAALARRQIAPSKQAEAEPAKAAAEAEAGAKAEAVRSRAAREGREIELQRQQEAAAQPKAGEQRWTPVTFRAGPKGAHRNVTLKPGESFRDFDAGPEMVVVPAGELWMGSKDGEGYDNERPRHKVTIPRAFAVGKYAVTFAEWDAYVADGPGGILNFGKRYSPSDEGWGRDRRPVINVSWGDAKAYIKWLSDKTGRPYRFLSEAEWEYACRAGSETAYSFGDNESDLGRHAWYLSNSGGKTHPVGEKAANDFGLRDMHGNVWEWCEDCWNNNYHYARFAWILGNSSLRVVRGGSLIVLPGDARAATRNCSIVGDRSSNLGFRVARTLTP
jgi:formylglycine-generating enzyme required for sulfatase activity